MSNAQTLNPLGWLRQTYERTRFLHRDTTWGKKLTDDELLDIIETIGEPRMRESIQSAGLFDQAKADSEIARLRTQVNRSFTPEQIADLFSDYYEALTNGKQKEAFKSVMAKVRAVAAS